MSKSIFSASDPYAHLSEHLRRSLGQARLEEPYVQKLLKACRAMRLKCHLGVYKENPDTWAHIGLERERVAIQILTFRQRERIVQFRQDWEKHGWKLLTVIIRDVINTPDIELGAQVLNAVKGLRHK